MYERVINLIGKENFDILQNKKILLIGVGGVGGFVFSSLIRSGIKNITIIDGDTIDLSNFNRQLIANLNTIGKYKVDVCKEIANNLNKDINVISIKSYLTKDNFNILNNTYDYIIDACDDVYTKASLVEFAKENNIKIISSMGVGNRLNAESLKIIKLSKTEGDPLAKKLRHLLKYNKELLNIPVLSSNEIPYKKGKIDSLITIPGVAGLLITNYVINDIIQTKIKKL